MVVDPNCRLPYITYVLQGFADLDCRIVYRHLSAPPGFAAAFELDDVKVWIDTNDMTSVEQGGVGWADVLAKVNVDETTPECIPLGPLFGLRFWSMAQAYATLPSMVVASAPIVQTLRGLRFQAITRRPIEAYQAAPPSEPGYVYSRSRAWTGKHETTNGPRERFMEALSGIHVERSVCIAEDRVSLDDYLANVRRSAVVFNAPAVHGCLGWKLGEFLALGKAIVSTPLGGRKLPADLVHGRDIHFVDDDVEAIREALVTVLGDDDYRLRLEQGARAWYQFNMSPLVAAKRIVNAVCV